MDQSVRDLVWQRSRGRCEYCQMPSEGDSLGFAFQIDHIIAQKHRGETVADNLALACYHCNNNKGPNIAGIDPATGSISVLFHPRRHTWSEHFRWEGPLLAGLTGIGRATIDVLRINDPGYVAVREALIEEGVFPPK
jgi:hypothetical protein